MVQESQSIKKRVINYSFPKSNYSLEEQISSIETCFAYMDKENTSISFRLAGKHFHGIKNDKYSFLKESSDPSPILLTPLYLLNYKFILNIINQLLISPIPRLFKITINESHTYVEDPLFKKKCEVENKEFIENTFSKETKVFYIDSRAFYIFKLNKKTINKKSYFFVTENEAIFLLERKKQKMLFTYSFN